MKKTAGVDEAGRGPWAGPVVAACVIINKNIPRFDEINDSKQLSEKKREELYEIIKNNSTYGIGVSSNKEIDKYGIVKATEIAIKRAIEHMTDKPEFLLIDGRDKFSLPIGYKSIIDGDNKVKSIAAASILAKVWRDRYMRLAADIYPNYGFDKHKGYGTKMHSEALAQYGICELHRISFKPIQRIIKEQDRKPRLLLHACCAPCATSVIERLKEKYELDVYFYNPNIHPKKEYEIRLNEIKRLCRHHQIKLHIGEYDTKKWFMITKRYKFEKEGARRCLMCYSMRMLETIKLAKKLNFDFFTTTLSVSPLKKYDKIRHIGNVLSKKYSILFEDTDFKKKDGFKHSVELSKNFGFYRQNYCGCVYSMRDSLKGRKKNEKETD